MDEILHKLEKIEARLDELEGVLAPLSLLNIFDGYSDMGNQYWLLGELQDLERQGEATRSANGDYLDLRNKEEYEYAKSESTDGFTPSEELMDKMLASAAGVITYKYLREEMDTIRTLYFKTLTNEVDIKTARKEAEETLAKRPKKLSYILRAPQFYSHLEEDDDLMKTITKYKDNRLVDEQKRWEKLDDPEERKSRIERYDEHIKSLKE